MNMTAKRLDALRQAAQGEPAMLRVALDGLRDAETIRTQLQTELAKHFRAKESFDGLVARIKGVAIKNATRAATIAQTEKTRAMNGSRYGKAIEDYLQKYEQAVQQHGKRPELPTFQWIHTGIAKEPRREHMALSGQVRAVGEEFLPGLKYPGDPDAPASQTINCHCYVRRTG